MAGGCEGEHGKKSLAHVPGPSTCRIMSVWLQWCRKHSVYTLPALKGCLWLRDGILSSVRIVSSGLDDLNLFFKKVYILGFFKHALFSYYL